MVFYFFEKRIEKSRKACPNRGIVVKIWMNFCVRIGDLK